MNVGCCGWSLGWLTDSETAINRIGEMGFKGIELILNEKKQLDEYYSRSKVKKLAEMVRSYDLAVSQFVIHAPLLDGLVTQDGREEALAVFRRGTEIAEQLGTNIINTVTHYLPGFSAPVDFLGNYVYVYVPGMKRLNTKFTMSLPDSVEWEKTWRTYVESIALCADIAQDADLLFSLELHTYGLVSNTDAFLKLYDDVGAKNLGINMDTGFHFAQREYLPMSIHKLGKKLVNMHTRDGDGLVCYHQIPGYGIIDWQSLVTALKKIGYNGFLDLETDFYGEDTDKILKGSKVYLENLL